MVTLKSAVFWNLRPRLNSPTFQKDPAPHESVDASETSVQFYHYITPAVKLWYTLYLRKKNSYGCSSV